jgi:TolB-like protein
MLGIPEKLNALVSELRRRRVFRVAAIYGVAAWVFIEVTSTIFPILLLPDWLMRVVVVCAVLGFPLALVLSWAFDITPDGVQRAEEHGGVEEATLQLVHTPGVRLGLVGLVVLVTVAAGWSSWGLWLRPGVGAAIGAGEDAPTAEGELDPSRVAVLYFDDHSLDGSLGHVASGLTESLIHELSQIELLSVISRNGVKPFRDGSTPFDTMVRSLGVGKLVEGSVERRGDRLKATIQLVDGRTGDHLLSQEIERQGDDLLALRDAIVEEGVRQLSRALGHELLMERQRAGTTSGEAWAEYQMALHLQEDADTLKWARDDETSARRALLRADSLLARAAALDTMWIEPIVERGWIARTVAGLYSASASFREEGLVREGIRYANQALGRRPGDPGALALRGTLRVDLYKLGVVAADESLAAAAEADLRAAVDLDPGLARAWVALAELLRLQGQFTDASVAAEHALDADPFLINAEKEVLFTLAQVWLELRDLEKAKLWFGEGRNRFPAEPAFPATKLVILAAGQGTGQVVDSATELLHEL